MARGRLIQAVADVNTTRRPEHDARLRVLVAGSVMCGVLAVLATTPDVRAEAALVLLVLPAAYWWSHRRRTGSNLAAKAVISILAVGVLVRFFSQLGGVGTIDDTRLPLIQLFLEIQVLHAFDLPQRRDLMFSLTSSLALVALSLAAAPGVWAFGLLLAYAFLAAAALHRCARSTDLEWVGLPSDAPHPAGATARSGRGGWVARGLVVLLASALLFSLIPQGGDGALGGLPVSFGRDGGSRPADAGGIGGLLPFEGAGGRASGQPVDYFGFSDQVDPRAVGVLDDTPVLRVRTTRPRPLRGVVFDTYTGGRWTRPDEEPRPSVGLPVELTVQRGEASRRDRVTQTIELLAPTPNLVFGAADPAEVWTAARSITPWDDGTLTTSVVMDTGTIYSVVSEVDTTAGDVLARMPADWSWLPEDDLARWTQLPADVPARVHDLAAQIAAGAGSGSPHVVALAVRDWIGANVGYSLDVPPMPASADPVDHLLFVRPRGWCEPIASSMVVMLRSQGIPARFVTGFQPGERDLLSGTFIVRAEDAHAWVEVLIPGVGWVSYDPTGATTAVLSPEGPGRQVPLLAAIAWLGRQLPRDPVTWAVLLIGLAALAGAVTTVTRARRAAALRRAGPWARLLALLGASGVATGPTETPREVEARARRLLPHLDPDALATVRAHEERRRYAAPGPDDEAAHRAVDDLVTTG